MNYFMDSNYNCIEDKAYISAKKSITKFLKRFYLDKFADEVKTEISSKFNVNEDLISVNIPMHENPEITEIDSSQFEVSFAMSNIDKINDLLNIFNILDVDNGFESIYVYFGIKESYVVVCYPNKNRTYKSNVLSEIQDSIVASLRNYLDFIYRKENVY